MSIPFSLGMDQYLYIPFLGDEHPFTSYFDVHQGYKVLTHCLLILPSKEFKNVLGMSRSPVGPVGHANSQEHESSEAHRLQVSRLHGAKNGRCFICIYVYNGCEIKLAFLFLFLAIYFLVVQAPSIYILYVYLYIYVYYGI